MSIFDRIKDAIFGEANAAPSSQGSSMGSTAPASSATPASQPPAQSGAATPAIKTPAPFAAQTANPALQIDGGAGSSGNSRAPVDVESILDEAAKKSGQTLEWRHSIVDLMKALGMDASIGERKELAQELGYTGDADDSAKMNTFLHKALMKKLSENGGKVPADLIN
jgi:hypothetical protein